MNNLPIQPVILCGGAGTRLWPLSRAGFPKQFLCLTGDDSLFQQAAKRLAGLATAELNVAEPIVVCNEDQRFLVLEQLCEIGVGLAAALLEPAARNTAPALTLAALAAMTSDGDPVLVVALADQTIIDQPAFTCSVHQAIHEAADGAFEILGTRPDNSKTGPKELVGWTPKVTVAEVIAELVREDLKSVERIDLVKHDGYKAMDWHESARPPSADFQWKCQPTAITNSL